MGVKKKKQFKKDWSREKKSFGTSCLEQEMKSIISTYTHSLSER